MFEKIFEKENKKNILAKISKILNNGPPHIFSIFMFILFIVPKSCIFCCVRKKTKESLSGFNITSGFATIK